MIDANVVYFVLILGLWTAVTAAYIPGTGVMELAALAITGAALFMLFNLPTNWVGLALIILGVGGFLLVPFLSARLIRLAQGGLILQAVGSAILLNGLQVSWLLIALVIGLSLAYHHLVLMPVLEKSRRKAAEAIGDEQLPGASGRVVRASERIGSDHRSTVNVRGEEWTAFSDHPLRAGEEVLVIERDGLQLYVESVKHKQTVKES